MLSHAHFRPNPLLVSWHSSSLVVLDIPSRLHLQKRSPTIVIRIGHFCRPSPKSPVPFRLLEVLLVRILID